MSRMDDFPGLLLCGSSLHNMNLPDEAANAMMSSGGNHMTPYVPSTEQLVVEIYTRDLQRSMEFYQALGFETVSAEPDFVVLAWEQHRFFLEPRPDLPVPLDHPQANVRIMVTDVDRYWALAQQLGAPVIKPIADRYYGLRDFTIVDPDGFGLRFGTRLAAHLTP
jgi:catechol 2,3-dioxygenase-like lactoylglutathione lyase family enzyme